MRACFRSENESWFRIIPSLSENSVDAISRNRILPNSWLPSLQAVFPLLPSFFVSGFPFSFSLSLSFLFDFMSTSAFLLYLSCLCSSCVGEKVCFSTSELDTETATSWSCTASFGAEESWKGDEKTEWFVFLCSYQEKYQSRG
jgi:hypothetical protein